MTARNPPGQWCPHTGLRHWHVHYDTDRDAAADGFTRCPCGMYIRRLPPKGAA